jgi:uncharacterized protein
MRPGEAPAEHPSAAVVRAFYAARARADAAAVGEMLAPDVVWHEAGSRPPYTGTLTGSEAVLAMIAKARGLTGGTFRLELDDVLANDRHAVALVVWTAERDGRSLRGREVAVFRVRHGRIVEVRFYPDDSRTVDEFWA